MTFRARPVVKRSSRAPWESQDRRNFFLNLGFGLVVLAAVLILVATAAASWYGDHFTPVAHVNGQAITRDDFTERYRIEQFRLDYAARRVATEFAAGRLTEAQRQGQDQLIQQRAQQLPSIALERLIDARVQAELATQEGVSVTPEQIDERLIEEATTPEQRHVWEIQVQPAVSQGADEPTAAQRAEAEAKAKQALADITSGKPWEDVARSISTSATAPAAGDLGWTTKDSGRFETALADKVFALEANGMTDVYEAEDGTFRIVRVTEIAPESVDGAYQQLIVDEGLSLESYRAAVTVDLVRKGLEDKVVAEVSKPGPQRQVSEIYIAAPSEDPVPEGSVKTRHILFAPNDAPQAAGQLPADDPAWAKAEEEARAAYDEIKADPKKFDEIARAQSDEAGSDISGGKLPYFGPESAIDPAFGAAIFADGLKPGDLLEPVKSGFGWHVIQVMYFPPDTEEIKSLKARIEGGADFAQLARDYSEARSAADGGDAGWIAHGQLDELREKAIFGTPIGELTDPIVVDGDGIYLYEVRAEETRTPEGDQLETLRQTAFSTWYNDKKAGFTITREGESSTGA